MFTNVKCGRLLGSPTPPTVVADVARLLTSASRTARIHVLSLTALVAASILIDFVLRSVLLLAGDGLLMVVRASRLCLGRGVLFFGAHKVPPALNLAAIAADLLRSVVHTVRGDLRIGPIGVGKRVLILGGAVADPLLGARAIGGAEIARS